MKSLPNCWCNSSPLLPLLDLIHKKPALPQQLQESGLDLRLCFPRQRQNNRDKENPSDKTMEFAFSWEDRYCFSPSPDLLPRQAEGILRSSVGSRSNANTPSMLFKEFPSAESYSVFFTSLSFFKK